MQKKETQNQFKTWFFIQTWLQIATFQRPVSTKKLTRNLFRLRFIKIIRATKLFVIVKLGIPVVRRPVQLHIQVLLTLIIVALGDLFYVIFAVSVGSLYSAFSHLGQLALIFGHFWCVVKRIHVKFTPSRNKKCVWSEIFGQKFDQIFECTVLRFQWTCFQGLIQSIQWFEHLIQDRVVASSIAKQSRRERDWETERKV